MEEELKQRVYKQNLELVKNNLVVLTWGNVSAINRETNHIVIKPSGVPYDQMKAEDMVVVDLNGKILDGKLNPSSDLPTHLYLYKKYVEIGGIVHTHSTFAVAFAQAGKEIHAYGTTHADAFYGNVPLTRDLTKSEIEKDYELNTGKVISETIDDANKIPAILVKSHGPFTWGKTPEKAVENAITLEEVAKMAYLTETLNKNSKPVEQYLLDKHYKRKHGKNSYYGQKKD